MVSEEPYRWLEAIQNRREYIEDQFSAATPVFAVSRPEGILLLGIGTGRSKVFEIFDRQAMASLGNPVDIEKLRQSAIEAAHLEGFNRAPEDVTLRRLVNYSLSTSLKSAFENIFAPPLIIQCVCAELGASAETDALCTLDYDGKYTFESGGVAVAAAGRDEAQAARDWIGARLKAKSSRKQVVALLLTAWERLIAGSGFEEDIPVKEASDVDLQGRRLELALLDRRTTGRVTFRELKESGP